MGEKASMKRREIRVRTAHVPVGDGWTCSCGYDFFGGSAGYSWTLYEIHIRAVLMPRWKKWLPHPAPAPR